MTKEEEKEIFIGKVFEYEDEFSSETLQEFCEYWTTVMKGKGIMRFQNNFTFDYHQRLLSWARRGQPGKSKAQMQETLEQKRRRFRERVYAFAGQYQQVTLEAFFLYWSETREGGTTMKWEMKQTFNIGYRLQTWAKNEEKYGNHNRKSFNRQQQLQDEERERERIFLSARAKLLAGTEGDVSRQLPDLS